MRVSQRTRKWLTIQKLFEKGSPLWCRNLVGVGPIGDATLYRDVASDQRWPTPFLYIAFVCHDLYSFDSVDFFQSNERMAWWRMNGSRTRNI